MFDHKRIDTDPSPALMQGFSQEIAHLKKRIQHRTVYLTFIGHSITSILTETVHVMVKGIIQTDTFIAKMRYLVLN